ncbi:MAG: membrane lipoprotein lipid attachment site-containing protein [Bacilli bacterium]|nr:membrane lipoprotein lipid attachment site-containing protein [Bacilli bacterium]
MKKIKIIVLLLIVFVLTGCSITTLDDKNYEKNVSTILSSKNRSYNVYFEGYKYYIPSGMKFVSKKEYNAVLQDTKNNKYYLYVDAISYYHKDKSEFEVDETAYYSKELSYNDIDGYLQIEEIDYKYLVQFMFNYSKIECYVSKEDLTDSINYMAYILRSVKFNRSVLGSLIGDNTLSYNEEEYSLFDKKNNSEDFLDVVYENDDAYKEAVDEDEIDLDSE